MQVAYDKNMEKVESPRRARRRTRLDELVREVGSATQVARESGIPKSHISAMQAGRRGLGDELVGKLEQLYGKPQGWFDAIAYAPQEFEELFTPPGFFPGDADIRFSLADEAHASSKGQHQADSTQFLGRESILGFTATPQSESKVVELGNFRGKSKPDEFVIPEFNTGGAMGNGLLLRDQPGVIRGWSVNAEWVQKNVKSHSGAQNLCIVTGFGDSMKGMFNPGDPLLVDRGVTTVEYDAVYFFRVADEGFIKRLQRIPGEGLRVLSENKKYESWTIKPGMDFEVFGRVVKAWQGEDF